MHMLTLFNTFLGICFVYEGGKFVRGQHVGLHPPRQFQYITMDLVHRGSFNNTDCLRELLNCWEIVKPDIICSRWTIYESVCGAMRNDCNEKHGMTDSLELPIFESFCKSRYYDIPT